MFQKISKYSISSWILLTAVYLFNTWLLIKYGLNNINSDMSSEMVLANLMNDHKDFLLCSNWSYSTEIRVVYLQAIYRISLLVFPNNWFYARVVSNMVIMLIFIIAFLHLCNTLKLGDIGIWLVIILICPISYHYYTNIGFGNAYVPHVLTYIVLTDLLIINSKKKSKIIDIFIFILGFIGGLNGIRIVYNYLIPLISTIIIREIIFRHDYICGSFKQAIKRHSNIILIALAIGIGFLINNFYLKTSYSFNDYLSDFSLSLSLNNLYTVCVYFFFLLGLSSISDIISGNYIYLLAVPLIITLLMTFIWSVKYAKRDNQNKNDFYEYVLIGVPLAVVELILIFFIMGQCNQRYWIPIVPFLLIYIGIYIKKANKNKLAILLVLCMFGVSYNAVKIYTDNTAEIARQELVDYLESNNYTQGYASFWNANVITELSNGEIDVWCGDITFNMDSTYKLFDWLQDKRHFTEEPKSNKVFLLINTRVDDIDGSSIEEYLGFEKGTYKVYLFDSYEQIKKYMNDR